MFRLFGVLVAVLALASAAQACPQNVVAAGQCYGAQNLVVPQAVVVQQPQFVVAQQYAVVPQAVVVNHAQAVVVQKQRVQRQRVVVRNQRSVQKVVVRH